MTPTVHSAAAAALEQETDQRAQAMTILERAVWLTLECHYLGNNRKVDLKDLVGAATDRDRGEELEVDEEQFHATKRLIPNAVLHPVMRVFGVAKAKLRLKAISGHRVFGERTHLIPLGLIREVNADLKACQADLGKAARAMAYGQYLDAVEAQKAKLGTLFDQEDYLTPAAVAAAFRIDWSWVSFASPDKLETVDDALAQEADAKYTAKLAQAFDDVLVGMRGAALDVIGDLEERLTPGPDGKAKRLMSTALRDVEQFIEYLPKQNLAGDGELAAVMARVAKRAAGVRVEDLRDSAVARASLLSVTSEAKVALAKLVEKVGRRGISFSGPLGG